MRGGVLTTMPHGTGKGPNTRLSLQVGRNQENGHDKENYNGQNDGSDVSSRYRTSIPSSETSTGPTSMSGGLTGDTNNHGVVAFRKHADEVSVFSKGKHPSHDVNVFSKEKHPKSAKRPERGSPVRSESPVSPRNNGQAMTHKPAAPKSASIARRHANIRSSISRERNKEKSHVNGEQEKEDRSPSPEVHFANGNGLNGNSTGVVKAGNGKNDVKPSGIGKNDIKSSNRNNKNERKASNGAGGERGRTARTASRQSRRLTSFKSDDVSGSSDLTSPRSVSSSSSSEDLRLQLSPTLKSNGSQPPLQKAGVPGRAGTGSVSGEPASPTLAPQIAHAWDMFEEHVRTIHDSSDSFSRRAPSFSASPTFQETMTEIFGYPDYAHPPPSSVPETAGRSRYVSNCAAKFLGLRKKSVAPTGRGLAREVSKRTVENAKRGWRILKQYVQDNYISKRTSAAALSWSMLRQTLIGMSDMDRTRWDLYKRYGIVPSLDSEGNVVMVNTMLSERARKAIASGSRHPLLAHNPSQPITGAQSYHVMGHATSQPRNITNSSAASHQQFSRFREKPLSASLPANFSFTFSGNRSPGRSRRAPVRPHTSASVGFGQFGLHVKNGGAPRTGSAQSPKTSLIRSHTP